jgi:hypothetical protein
MFSISLQVFKSNQWQLRSSLRQPMKGEALLESVQLRTSLVSHIGESRRLTSRISNIFSPSPKILKPLLHNFPFTC